MGHALSSQLRDEHTWLHVRRQELGDARRRHRAALAARGEVVLIAHEHHGDRARALRQAVVGRAREHFVCNRDRLLKRLSRAQVEYDEVAVRAARHPEGADAVRVGGRAQRLPRVRLEGRLHERVGRQLGHVVGRGSEGGRLLGRARVELLGPVLGGAVESALRARCRGARRGEELAARGEVLHVALGW